MAAFYAEFRWPLPPDATSVQRYAEALAERSGCPYECDIRPPHTPNVVSAALAFPYVSDKNLLSLEGQEGSLDFAPVPFIWIHALHTLEVLGGTLIKVAPAVDPTWRVRRWEELNWKERTRLRFGFWSGVR